MKVLFVEDNAALRTVMQLHLELLWGYKCELARNGYEAFKILREEEIDIVLTDSERVLSLLM